ncbi:MAG: putative dehydrogenase like protein [candidate division NC10 bacterium]|nr:putative dehydrogenase like protein [candidate division NC10 bacterium]
MKLTGKAALVTGGGTGMGRAITLKFAAEGANVAINYSRRAKEADETVAAAQRLGVRAFAMKADVSIEAEAVRLVEETVKQFGRLDVLVNNAGWSTVVPHRKLDGLTEDILERTWQTNVKGPIYVTRAAIPHLLKGGGGSIVNTTSVAAYQGAGSSIIYGASKAALGAITKSLARAFAKDNIRVNAIAPGFVDTQFVDWAPGVKEKQIAVSPMGRIPTPEDAANAVLYLACDATGVTAQTIFIDCGVTALQPIV